MKKHTVTVLLMLCLFAISATVALSQSSEQAVYLPLVLQGATTQPTATPTATTSGPTASPTPEFTATTTPPANAYYQSGGSAEKSNQTYEAYTTDLSAVKVTNNGTFTLSDSTIIKTGDTSSNDNSSFYGLNAALLANAGSTIHLSGSSIYSNAKGANGAFSTGSGSLVTLTDVAINANGGGAHGVMATQGGVMTMNNVDIITTGANSAPIATDRGGGYITVTGGESNTSGQDSPCIYSTGVITVTQGTCTATGSEIAAIEGANSIILVNTTLTTTFADKWGFIIYQSMSGDASGARGIFTITGGALANTAATGPLFYVTNSTGIITLSDVDVTAASGTLLAAEGNDRWGTIGNNGGLANFTAYGQTLVGDLVVDDIGALTATLQTASTLTGAINADHAAGVANLTLDGSSTWTVTANSYLTCLSDPDGISGTTITNIVGNGYTVYYDSTACPDLGGLTYTLVGGGTLQPVE